MIDKQNHCEKCGKKMKMDSELVSYLLSAERYTPWMCQICEKQYLKTIERMEKEEQEG